MAPAVSHPGVNAWAREKDSEELRTPPHVGIHVKTPFRNSHWVPPHGTLAVNEHSQPLLRETDPAVLSKSNWSAFPGEMA